jgi:hypothetical protein
VTREALERERERLLAEMQAHKAELYDRERALEVIEAMLGGAYGDGQPEGDLALEAKRLLARLAELRAAGVRLEAE